MCGRHLECARTADNKYRREQHVAIERAGQECRCDHDRGQRIDAMRGTYDQAPIVPVRGVTDQQGQDDCRHELDKSNKPKVESAVGDLVYLPGDCEGQHLVAHRRREPRQPEKHERTLPG